MTLLPNAFRADPVIRAYSPGFAFTGGRVLGVGVDVSGDQYLDFE